MECAEDDRAFGVEREVESFPLHLAGIFLQVASRPFGLVAVTSPASSFILPATSCLAPCL
jgi:hypothetical protein